MYTKFGVEPEKVIDVQVLAGDSADGVKGVRGVGVKRAAALIQKYGSWQTVVKHSNSLSPFLSHAVNSAYENGDLEVVRYDIVHEP